jgi:membrane-bound lytic murein transglycosylase D
MHDMRLLLKEAVLVLVACSVASCSAALKSVPSESAAVKSTTVVSGSSSVYDGGDPSAEAIESQTTWKSASSLSSSVAPESKENQQKEPQEILDEALEFCQASQDFWGQGDFENAIASLDQAYNLILLADTNENPKFIQQKEDIRFMICKRMLEIYASRHTVVNGDHDAIPMVMNRHVKKEIELFRGQERKFFLDSYKRSGRYRPEILKALEEAGLPKELSWLPLIESGFKIRALSRARALGLWQFIPSTGYKFGLRRDQWIDERMDVSKSTRAAIAYLQELHRIFGDWCTVLAAYNCGEGKVLRVIRNQNIAYLDNFWDLFEKLPWETARYVPRFLAALHIINDPQQFGLDLKDAEPAVPYELVTISKQVRLKKIAIALHVPAKSLETLNAELRHKVTPPQPYELKVPPGKGPVLIAKLDKIPVYTPPRRLYAYHRVRPGQTLSQLAERYRTSVRAIMEANNLRSKNFIRAGQRLRMPTRGSRRIYAMRETLHSDTSKPLRHRVRRGDSLWLLARGYNTNIRQIMRLNNLKSTRLHIGQELIIRKGTHNVEPPAGTKTYQVKRGDSPYLIAMRHNMKLGRFLRINDLTPRSKIYPEQVFLVDPK